MAIDVVDSADVPVAVIQRSEVFRTHANFRVIHVLVFNTDGELLIQQIAFSRKRHPGYWGSSVAGYIFAGETYQAAAERRVFQELGLRKVRLSFVGKTTMFDDGCLKFIAVFAGTFDGSFHFDHNQIQKLEFFPVPAIDELVRSGSRPFTPTFLQVLKFYESRM